VTPERPWRRRAIGALLLSFLVYAIPLPGPHAMPLLGTWLAGAFTGANRDVRLGLATLLLAIAAQVVAFGIACWVLGGRRRWPFLLAFAPALALGVNVMALLVVPRWVLVERDGTPENLAWPVACAVPDASVLAVRSPPDGDLARAGVAWLRVGRDASTFVLLRSASCAATRAMTPPPRGTMHGIVHATAVGATIETTWDQPAQRQLWWWRASPEAEPLEVALPSPPGSVPILSRDGVWLVLVERSAPPPQLPRIVLRRPDGSVSHDIGLEAAGPGSFVPLAATVAVDADGTPVSADVLLCRNDSELLRVDFTGAVTPVRAGTPDLNTLSQGLRLVDSGWVAWDAYVEGRPYAVAWETAFGRGRRELPRGRGITSADADPVGRFVAVSTSAIYSLGGVEDSVVVIDTADGREVFRDSLPAYARSEVAFVGDGLLAYTAWDGESPAEVRIVGAP
jgi:hypothetical protein